MHDATRPPAPLATAQAMPVIAGGTSGDDFNLHGLVGIRLVDATDRDRATVMRQIGPIAAPLHRSPDIVIRFVDELPPTGTLQLIGLGDAGYDDSAFYLLRSKHKSAARVKVAFETIGDRCEIVCERGVAAVPLLMAIINLTVLARGGLALHASAFRHRDTGVLVTGWSKGGKTELLLAFIEHGAEYIGDEWIYIAADGSSMFGIPEPIRVWDWHLEQLPGYRASLAGSERWRLAALRHTHRACAGTAALARAGSGLRRNMLRVANLVDRQRYAFLSPERAFGRPLGALAASIDRVVFVGCSADDRTRLDRVSPFWVADRMVHSLAEERSVLDAGYRRFRFAFPEKRNRLLENAAALEHERLQYLLADRPCFSLMHPYPPSIREMYQAATSIIPA